MSHELIGYLKLAAGVAIVALTAISALAQDSFRRKKAALRRSISPWSVRGYLSELVTMRETYILVLLALVGIISVLVLMLVD